MAFIAPPNVTAGTLYDAISRFGVEQAAQMGYFNNLLSTGTSTEGIPVVQVAVKAPADTGTLPPTYGSTTLDLSPYKLNGAFVLTGTISNGIDGTNYTIDFRNVSSTSAVVHVASSTTTGSAATLDVIVNVKISL